MSSSQARSGGCTRRTTASTAPARGGLELNRQGVPVARCTVKRLMRELGLTGARRGRRVRTTRPDPAAARPADLVQRDLNPPAPHRTWVADFTHVPTWSGMGYVAFALDAYSRRILGWRAATCRQTSPVLDALEQAVWTRTREGARTCPGWSPRPATQPHRSPDTPGRFIVAAARELTELVFYGLRYGRIRSRTARGPRRHPPRPRERASGPAVDAGRACHDPDLVGVVAPLD